MPRIILRSGQSIVSSTLCRIDYLGSTYVSSACWEDVFYQYIYDVVTPSVGMHHCNVCFVHFSDDSVEIAMALQYL